MRIVTYSLGAGCDGREAASGGFPPTRRRARTAKSCGSGAATLASVRREVSRRQRWQQRPLTGKSTYKP